MEWMWTWGGASFGFRDNDNLWTHDGRHVGRFRDDFVYASDGSYLGEICDTNRLITKLSRKGTSRRSFAPRARRMGRIKRMSRIGRIMRIGCEDFPEPDDL
jgi:hypothetical protein